MSCPKLLLVFTMISFYLGVSTLGVTQSKPVTAVYLVLLIKFSSMRFFQAFKEKSELKYIISAPLNYGLAYIFFW